MSTTDLRQQTLSPIVALQCSSWSRFAERYVDDLARGALCLAHPEPLPLLQPVTVQLSLPDSVEITLAARVVQVITGPHAQQLGSQCALALELDLDGDSKRQLGQLVEFARAQRDGASEQTSFARAMLEHTPSLPPRELGMRLSQLPTQYPSGSPKRAGSTSTASLAPPAVNAAPSDSGYRHTAAARLRRHDVTRPLSPARMTRAIRGKGATTSSASDNTEPAAPNPQQVNALLSNVARKQYDVALGITNELLDANPADRQAQRWRALCYARIALSRDDYALAAQAYEAMLELDPSDREARDFLKARERTKKLESLPFGRFFTKKK